MIYTTGTIAINGNTVTGTGTNFSAPLSLIRVGCTLIAIGNPVQIFTITEIKNGTELSVTPAANPAIPAGTKFSILLSDSISVDGLAQDVAETLRYYQGKETEIAAAAEWWNEFGGDGQMEQLLADIRAETAQSTANAQKTEADKNAAAASKTAAANSATVAKASQDAAKASETAASNSKTAAATSETNAAKAAADALNYRNQAQGIVGTSIGLGSAPRDCPDISGNPSGYVGFMRIREAATGFPSIASGEAYLTGFICGNDGSPSFTGVFQGWSTRSLYTYRWGEEIGPQWTRHVRKDEVDRFSQIGSDQTRIYSGNGKTYFEIGNDRAWGVYNGETGQWKPLDIAHGGTGAVSVDNARTNLGLGRNSSPQLDSMFLDRTSDATTSYTSSGMLHTRLLASDNTVRLAGDMYVQTLPNEQGRLTIRFTCGGSTSTTKYLDLTSEGNLLVDSAILKSTVEKPLQINSANPAIRFNETDRPANTPTYTLIANAGDWFIQKRDYDDAGSVSNAIAYNFAEDRLYTQNIKATGLITSNSGIATLTESWSTQHTDNVNKFKPIAGSEGGPDGTMVVGGFHAQFIGNYATQFAGRNSNFWARSFEAGVDKGWKRLLTVDDLNSSTDLSVKSVTTSSPVKSGGGRVDVLGSIADFSAMSCYVRGLNSTGSSAAWVLGMHSGENKMVSLKNCHSNAEVLLNGSDGAVQLKTGTVNGATAQALTINKDEVNSTVDLALTKQTGNGNRLVLQNLGNTELPITVKTWGSGERQNVFEVVTSAGYLFYAQKTSAGQLFDVNGAINCTTLNQSSDRDLKDDILVISDATKAIRKMNGYTYTLRENGMPYAGVIAQEVIEALPEAVGSFTHYGEELQGPTVDGNELREETRYLNVDYAAVTGLLVQVARETDNRVTELEEENASLRANIAVMDERITKLEALVSQLTGSEK
ncbi:TPA: tail fiber domain-containing protein [Escherichia coli]